MNNDNPNPVVHAVSDRVIRKLSIDHESASFDEAGRDPVDPQEIFDWIRHINDPEHPLTLEELNVLSIENIQVDDVKGRVHIYFTPTVPHCSMATLIGLFIRVKLLRALPRRFKVDIEITPGTHVTDTAVNKQINDKERVAAALCNPNLLSIVNRGIKDSDERIQTII